jgi:single-strand DNA-binding protein
MSDINQVLLLGRLGHDPVIRQTKNQKTVAQLNVATNYGDKESGSTTWHKVSVWGKQAELCQKYLVKGSQIMVQGRIKYSKYETADGQKRDATEITADQITFLGRPKSVSNAEMDMAVN